LGAATTQKLNLGRLLTLLSVRHLLMFHLNDLSRNGYSFDKLSADLHFNSGIVTTENLQSEGAVADIKAKGMVDLKTKTLDLWMGVDTNLSASLPIIATIAGGPIFGPIAGAATWVVSKFVHNEMREHSGYGYHIYGAWAKPTIKQITTDKPS